MEKRQINDDIFTDSASAVARSFDLGYEGRIHSSEVDGQKVFRPGESAEEYLGGENEDGKMQVTVTVTVDGFAKSKETLLSEQTVLKIDNEQRIVWGWASVTTVKGNVLHDLHNDVISTDEMVNAANNFMLDVRAAKAMHEGANIGEVIHSMPLTKELGDSLGIQCELEGWIIAMKIHDDKVWEKVKSGEFAAFSIGGRAQRHAR